MSQTEPDLAVGISQSVIWQIESGFGIPKVILADVTAKALGGDISDIVNQLILKIEVII